MKIIYSSSQLMNIERKVHKIVLYPTFYCCNAFRHLD